MLRKGGHLLLLQCEDIGALPNGVESLEPGSGNLQALDHPNSQLLSAEGFRGTRRIALPPSSILQSAIVTTRATERVSSSAPRNVQVLHFMPISDDGTRIIDSLEKRGWNMSRHYYLSQGLEFQFDGTILLLDDLTSPFLSNISQEHWETLQALSRSHNRILWLTEGSQLEVTMPEKAQIHGLMRTLRDEDPSINFTTLDLESTSGEHSVPAIHTILEHLRTSEFEKTGDYEFVERRGTIYISRVVPDRSMNNFTKAEREGAEIELRSFADTTSQIRLNCERVGSLDSLKFSEASLTKPDLRENEIEIEIAAAGLNFKDIAICSGLIPGNQRLLGFEGSGVVRRSKSNLYRAGQRVMFTKPGSFANTIVAETELVHPIPDSMSFEEAATLGAVYPVALYSLFDLANTRKGQRVLIHSAAGGLGIACIQLCQYIGAEIYATVGNEEKRRFLIEEFGINPSRISNSRSTLFAEELMNATHGEGVDVIINSLTGDLLEASWACIRDGGTMVELGKKDMLEKNYLPMEPFTRNVSYRSFDISHKSVPNSLLSRLLKQVFALLAERHIKPISPISVFLFEDIAAAFRYMRDGKHMGKIVVSNGLQENIRIPVRPKLRRVRLRDDISYLIVGGLKGLCGSIALHFARLGARHLTVMARSGFVDQGSRRVIRNIEAEGSRICLVRGDVTIKEDVKRAFVSSGVPLGGILQGAMVVRGKMYQAMTAEDYHTAVACKIQGTWNLHNLALEENASLDFFSILSSTSGVAGQSGQANYVAANAFLDAFATYRRSLRLRTNSIALGPVWELGYMSRNKDLLPRTNTSTYNTITEANLLKIIEYSILQQTDPINEESASHLITGMAIPLKESSTLRCDARFSPLFGSAATTNQALGAKGASNSKAMLVLQASPGQSLNTLQEIMSQQLVTILQLNEAIKPAAPLGNYGMESLAATELRNWIRMELQADVTMLEIVNVASLTALCGKVLVRMRPSL